MTLPIENELFNTLEADGFIHSPENEMTYKFDFSRIEEDRWIGVGPWFNCFNSQVVGKNGGTFSFDLCEIIPSDASRKLLLIQDFTGIFGKILPSDQTEEILVARENGKNSIIDGDTTPRRGICRDVGVCRLPKIQIFVNDVMQFNEVVIEHGPVLLDIPASTDQVKIRVQIHNQSDTDFHCPRCFDLIRAVLYR